MKKTILFPLQFLFIITASWCPAQTPVFWGLAGFGGQYAGGALFKTTDADTLIAVHDFGDDSDGSAPVGSLTLASNGLLYGTTEAGGIYTLGGTIFSYNIAADTEIVVHNFGNGTDGMEPQGSLIQVNDSLLYGMTNSGGIYGGGTIFSFNLSTGVETDLYNFGFAMDAYHPVSDLLQENDSMLFGMTYDGGLYSLGAMFSFNMNTDSETIIHSFGNGSDGYRPQGALIEAYNGLLYGMTSGGGANDSGTLFSFKVANDSETIEHAFAGGTDGSVPLGSLLRTSGSLLYGMTFSGGTYSAGTIFSYNIAADTEIVLHNFEFPDTSDGADPQGSLILASNGLLYGMTSLGGLADVGTVFSYDISNGQETDIANFNGTGGSSPLGNLLQDGTTTGIAQLTTTTAPLQISPNPSTGQFNITLPVGQTNSWVEVYNVLGEKVYENVISNSQNIINLSTQSAGMYFVYLKSDQGIETAKVMVMK